MKASARRLLVGLSLVAALVVLAVGALLLPPVQRLIALRVLGGAVPGEVALGSISVGPGGVTVADAVLGLAPAHVSLGRAEVKLDWGALIFGRQIVIRSLELEGLVADLTRPDPSHQPKPLSGVVNEVPPTPFVLDRIELEARVIAAPGQKIDLQIEGGGYGKGRVGKIEVEATVSGPKRVEARLTVGLEPDATGALAGITVVGPVRVVAPAGEVGAEVLLDLASRRASGTETLKVALKLPEGQTPFLALDGSFDAAAPAMKAEFKLAVGDAETALIEALAGQDLPRLKLAGNGTLDHHLGTGDTDVRLAVDGAIEEAVGTLPAADLSLDIDASLSGGVADVRALGADLRARGTPARVSVRALKPFRWDPALGPKGLPAEDLVTMEAASIPLAWAGVPGLVGELRDLALSAKVEGGILSLRSLRQAVVVVERLDDASGARLVNNLTVTSGLEVSLDGEALKATLGPVQVDAPSGRLASATVTVTGRVGAALALDRVTVTGTADLGRLAAQPALASIPAAAVSGLGATLDLEATLPSGSVKLERGAVSIARGNESSMLRVDLAPRTLPMADPVAALRDGGRIATVTFDRLPLGLANPFLPPGYALGGGLVTGSVELSGSRGGLSARTVAPSLRVDGLAVEDGQGPLLAGVGVSLAFDATASSDGRLSASVPTLRLESGGKELLGAVATLAPSGNSLGVALEGRMDLGAWGAQPLGSRLAERPAAGDLRLKAVATVAATGTTSTLPSAKVEVNGTGLVLGSEANFPRLSLVAELAPSAGQADSSTVGLAFDLESARGKSDLRVNGALRGAPGALSVDLRATSAFLSIPDLQALASLVPAGSSEDDATTPAPGSEGPLPPWSGLSGEINATLAKVALPGRGVVDAVEARIVLTEQSAELARFAGRFGQDPFLVAARVGFDAKRTLPYDLVGTIALDRLDAAQVLPPSRAGAQAMIEGVFAVKGEFRSAATTPAGLGASLKGNLSGSSTGGKVHPMAGLANERPGAANLANAGLGLAGALLGRGGDSGAGSSAGRLDSLLGLFRTIPYERFDFAVKRDDGPIELSELALVGSEIRLAAAGTFDLDPAKPWREQPIQLPLRLLVRGKAAYLLDQASLLTGRRTQDGWYEGPTYVQGGTLAAPSSNLRELLTRALVSNLVGRRIGVPDPDAPPPAEVQAPQPQ